MNDLYMMGIITNRGMRHDFTALFKDYSLHVTLSLLATGTANSAVLSYLGLEAAQKQVYFAFVSSATWDKIRKALYHQLRIDIPGRGIAFLIPFSSIGGKKTLQYLTADQAIALKEESTLKNTEYELLVTIANGGNIEAIMDAARSANAPGGTVLHAKGTGMEHAKKFFGISLAEEKELILIVVRAPQKQSIMQAIMRQAGPGTPAGAVIFSLPVTSVAGMRFMEEEEA